MHRRGPPSADHDPVQTTNKHGFSRSTFVPFPRQTTDKTNQFQQYDHISAKNSHNSRCSAHEVGLPGGNIENPTVCIGSIQCTLRFLLLYLAPTCDDVHYPRFIILPTSESLCALFFLAISTWLILLSSSFLHHYYFSTTFIGTWHTGQGTVTGRHFISSWNFSIRHPWQSSVELVRVADPPHIMPWLGGERALQSTRTPPRLQEQLYSSDDLVFDVVSYDDFFDVLKKPERDCCVFAFFWSVALVLLKKLFVLIWLMNEERKRWCAPESYCIMSKNEECHGEGEDKCHCHR